MTTLTEINKDTKWFLPDFSDGLKLLVCEEVVKARPALIPVIEASDNMLTIGRFQDNFGVVIRICRELEKQGLADKYRELKKETIAEMAKKTLLDRASAEHWYTYEKDYGFDE